MQLVDEGMHLFGCCTGREGVDDGVDLMAGPSDGALTGLDRAWQYTSGAIGIDTGAGAANATFDFGATQERECVWGIVAASWVWRSVLGGNLSRAQRAVFSTQEAPPVLYTGLGLTAVQAPKRFGGQRGAENLASIHSSRLRPRQ